MRLAPIALLLALGLVAAPAHAQPPTIKRQPGVQSPVPMQPRPELTPSSLKALTPAKSAKSRDIVGVDYVARGPGQREITGVNFVARMPGTREISGVDFTGRTPGTREIDGVNFVARTPGTREISGVDFVAR